MSNARLDTLPSYPFPRLEALLAGIAPGAEPLALSIGEPQHAPPALITPILAEHATLWHKYPPIAGTPAYRRAAAGWLERRFALPADMIEPDRHVLPLAGTREGLYLLATAVIPQDRPGPPPAVLLPNPFYQVYAGAAVLNGAELVPLPATAATGFLPDLDAIAEQTLARTALFYLCSPANPQGAVADRAYLHKALRLARHYGFVLALDECYADLYDRRAPVGLLEVCAAEGGALDQVCVFHSLSKRSSSAGLRVGFVAGDAALIARFAKLRSYCAATVPLPILAAATALWNDDAHAADNRARYRAKIDAAQEIFGDRFGFYRPPGGFFLWLDVGDGETAAQAAWRHGGIRTLPGRYLALDDPNHGNPGARYLRVALVHDLATARAALERLAASLAQM